MGTATEIGYYEHMNVREINQRWADKEVWKQSHMYEEQTQSQGLDTSAKKRRSKMAILNKAFRSITNSQSTGEIRDRKISRVGFEYPSTYESIC